MKKKRIGILLSLVALALSVAAETRSIPQALAIAEARWQTAAAPMRGGADGIPREMRLSETRMMSDGKTPAFYVFNRGEEEGWIIVSAETGTQEVLAYGESGEMTLDATRANVAWWMERYAAHAEMVRNNPALAVRKASEADTYSNISPIIGSKWSQDNPYNLYCPSLSGQRCPTGCVATAVGQIMYKYKYPARGKGEYSYYWEGGSKTLSVDYANTTYYWSRMTPRYSSTSTTQAKEAVATLLYHVGVCCDMDYATDGSGAQGDDVMLGLVRNFDYSAKWKAYDLRGTFSGYYPATHEQIRQTAMLNFMQTELQAGRPMLITGYSYTETSGWGGHAFVCEGMREDGYIYINWGWGGISDGYFALDNMNPDEQSTGGTDGAYQYMITVYGHIEPAGYTPELNRDFVHAQVVDSSSVMPGKVCLTLTTADYTGLSTDTTSTRLDLVLYTRDAASLSGTWMLDTTGLAAAGGINYAESKLHYGGNQVTETIESGMLTIVPGDMTYTFYLELHSLGQDIVDTLTLSMQDVSARSASGIPYLLADTLPTWVNTTLLVPYVEAHLSRTADAPVPVMLQSSVKQLIYNQSQVASNGMHRFFVNGLESSYSLAIKDIQYLHGERWTAERFDSVQVGDTVTIFGPIRRYNTNQPIIEHGVLLSVPGKEDPTTALKNTESNLPRASKVLRNGQICILRGREWFTLWGTKVE